jgi:hypothetical protein
MKNNQAEKLRIVDNLTPENIDKLITRLGVGLGVLVNGNELSDQKKVLNSIVDFDSASIYDNGSKDRLK